MNLFNKPSVCPKNIKKKLNNSRLYFHFSSLCLGIFSGLLATTSSVMAAERIGLKYDIGTAYVSVADLEKFAKEGDVSPVLSVYQQILQIEDQEKLRRLLLTPAEASPWAIQQFNNTPLGTAVLSRFGNIIRVDNGQNGLDALKTAINKASGLENGLTLLGILQEFPSETIEIDLNYGVDIIRDLSQIIYEDKTVINWINQQAKTKTDNPAINKPHPNFKNPGSIRWEKQTFTFQNPNRDRPSPVDIYIPQVSTPTSVIVISHGLGSDRNTFKYLAEHLASHGYFVAVVEHLATSAEGLGNFFQGLSKPPNPTEFINRPLDIKLLLDALEKKANAAEFPSPLLLNNVGVLGQSYGGYTALALAGAKLNPNQLNQECDNSTNRRITLNISVFLQCRASDVINQANNIQDKRVKAIIAINPFTSLIFGEEGMSQVKIPTLMIGSSNDYVAPAFSEQIIPFTWLKNPEKHLILLDQGTHFSFLEPGESVLPVPAQMVGPDPQLSFPYLKAISLVFFNSYIRDEVEYLPFLSPGYIKRMEQAPFGLSIIDSLTKEELQAIISDPSQ